MKPIIKKILREYVENRTEKDDFMMYVDYAQKKAIKNSNYPEETKKLDKLKDKLQKRVKTAYMNVTGEKPVSDDNIIVKVDDNIKKGKIGSFVHPENEKDIGIMKVHPDALEDKEYVEDIIKHELIHAAHGVENETARKHGGVFQKVADKVNLPKKYRH